MEYAGAARNRKGEQERDRYGCSNSGSAPLLWGRDPGLNGTTAQASAQGMELAELFYHVRTRDWEVKRWKKILCNNETNMSVFIACRLRDSPVNHWAYPAPRAEYDVIFWQRACHIILINSKNIKATMLLLLFSRFRKELSSKDVREFSLLVNPCSTLTVLSSATVQRIWRHIYNGLGIWFLLQMTLQTF